MASMAKQYSAATNLYKTMRPRKTHKSIKAQKLHTRVKATLGSGVDMRQVVKLPDSEDVRLDEWVAIHVVDFYNDISLLYGAISEICTVATCPAMTCGPKHSYLWADGVKILTPVELPACQYINSLMEWADAQLSDERLFPLDENPVYPDKFARVAQTILKRLFRVYAHIYHSHFTEFVQLGAEAHLNTCFKRFAYFVKEFNLVEERELASLAPLIESMMPAVEPEVSAAPAKQTPEELQAQFEKLGGGAV